MKKFMTLITAISLLSCSDDSGIEEVSTVYHGTFEVGNDFTWSDISTTYDLNGDSINDVILSTTFDTLAPNFSVQLRIQRAYDLGNDFAFSYNEDNSIYLDLGDIISSDATFTTWGESNLTRAYFEFQGDEFDTIYIGYRINKSSKTFYGWMRLDFFQLKEFATNLNPDDGIEVGIIR